MDLHVLFLLLTVFSPGLTMADKETDCKRCQPIRPMRDFNVEKVNVINNMSEKDYKWCYC